MKRAKHGSLTIILFASFAVSVFFQNCGKGFQSVQSTAFNSSAQCVTKLRSGEVRPVDLNPAELRCDDLSAYVCERRIFKPGIPNDVRVSEECSADHTRCVEVTVRQYDTNVARAAEVTEDDFAEGGQLNHEEIKCNYRIPYHEVSLFVGEGHTVQESLAGAISECQRTEGSGS